MRQLLMALIAENAPHAQKIETILVASKYKQ